MSVFANEGGMTQESQIVLTNVGVIVVSFLLVIVTGIAVYLAWSDRRDHRKDLAEQRQHEENIVDKSNASHEVTEGELFKLAHELVDLEKARDEAEHDREADTTAKPE